MRNRGRAQAHAVAGCPRKQASSSRGNWPILCFVHDGATTTDEETLGASLRVRWQALSEEGASLRLASQGVWGLKDKAAVSAFWKRLEVHLARLKQFAADLDAFQAKYGHRLGLDA